VHEVLTVTDDHVGTVDQPAQLVRRIVGGDQRVLPTDDPA
jgi:hypothetical protein